MFAALFSTIYEWICGIYGWICGTSDNRLFAELQISGDNYLYLLITFGDSTFPKLLVSPDGETDNIDKFQKNLNSLIRKLPIKESLNLSAEQHEIHLLLDVFNDGDDDTDDDDSEETIGYNSTTQELKINKDKDGACEKKIALVDLLNPLIRMKNTLAIAKTLCRPPNHIEKIHVEISDDGDRTLDAYIGGSILSSFADEEEEIQTAIYNFRQVLYGLDGPIDSVDGWFHSWPESITYDKEEQLLSINIEKEHGYTFHHSVYFVKQTVLRGAVEKAIILLQNLQTDA